MTCVTTSEKFRLFWFKCSDQNLVILLRLWDLCLKGEILLTTSEIFRKSVTEKKALYFGLKALWSLLPKHMRQINSFDQFKRNLRQWACNTCPC